jgi:hypothetical protein
MGRPRRGDRRDVTAVSKLSPLEWIEARLTHLSPTADRELVLKHAGTIFGAVVGIKASQPAKLVHGIRVRVKGRPKRVGTRDELQALRAAANKAVASERLEQREFWAATWIDTSEETRRAIEWDARTAVGEERHGVGAVGTESEAACFPYRPTRCRSLTPRLSTCRQSPAQSEESAAPVRESMS